MSDGRSLIAVNFRDPTHPEAGGAELHLEHVLREAARRGMQVTWLASGFPGGAPDQRWDGMRIVRRGTWWNFNWAVRNVLRRDLARPAPEFVIEDINKAPCFTPLWTRTPVGVVIPHLFGTTAFREVHPLVAAYVVLLEAWIPFVYRKSRFVVISESTRDDLVRRGVARGRITVVHCGLEHDLYHVDPSIPKSDRPTILYLGRLRRYKGVDWVLRALPGVLARVPDARLLVVGDGPFGPDLRRAAARLGVERSVEFLGFQPLAEKVRLLRSAWVLVQPSPKEGWGLTVIEAGGCGTAVVAADSPGLRDSVRHDVTGLLVPYGDDARLADALATVLERPELRDRLAAAGVDWARRFQWRECGARTLDALLGNGETE